MLLCTLYITCGGSTIIEGQHYKYPVNTCSDTSSSYLSSDSLHSPQQHPGCNRQFTDQTGAAARSTERLRNLRHRYSDDKRRLLPYQHHLGFKNPYVAGVCSSSPYFLRDSSLAFLRDSEHLLFVRTDEFDQLSCLRIRVHFDIYAKSAYDNFRVLCSSDNRSLFRSWSEAGESMKKSGKKPVKTVGGSRYARR